MEEFVTIGADRPPGFTLFGQKFDWRGVTPKEYSEWLGEGSSNGTQTAELTWESLCERADELILVGLASDEDRDRWRALRAGTLEGEVRVPTVQDVIAVRNWIMEVETGRPPRLETPSSDGLTESTEASSTEESSQEEVTQVA